ncbi:MAG: hypothetical protein JO000_07870 [Alphaproteobacteria bacterium]|nr:hypothetical protein [Alphaproteobacteria bacterium]
MTTPSVSESELGVFLKRAGFALTPEQIAEYQVAYDHIAAMAARLRRERSTMAEPAHVFGDVFQTSGKDTPR